MRIISLYRSLLVIFFRGHVRVTNAARRKREKLSEIHKNSVLMRWQQDDEADDETNDEANDEADDDTNDEADDDTNDQPQVIVKGVLL